MTNDPASPPCAAGSADDSYMGYADRAEILAALNELLEAERAGARVALGSAKDHHVAGYHDFMLGVRDDEAGWCAMLVRNIERLDGTPSHETGAFKEKAMAIADPLERLAFVNRGQGWVVKKIRDLLPRIRDEALHADLQSMADHHRINIERANSFIETAGARPA